MPLTITRKALSRITTHGLNVYPLEAFGILLGTKAAGEAGADVLAALPVGKTERWYEPDGRFSSIGQALAMALSLFGSWQLHPIGLYCTLPDILHNEVDFLATVPRSAELVWPRLLLRATYGGESIFGARALRWNGVSWEDEDITVVSPLVDRIERNPRRVMVAWNRAWGILDYGNRHETELLRLGLPVP